MHLDDHLEHLRARFEDALKNSAGEATLDSVRVAFLGRSGEVTALRRSIGKLPPSERPAAGQRINEAVEKMERALNEAQANAEALTVGATLSQRIDVTFPSIPPQQGSIHPMKRVM